MELATRVGVGLLSQSQWFVKYRRFPDVEQIYQSTMIQSDEIHTFDA